jgi:hypothetical protein
MDSICYMPNIIMYHPSHPSHRILKYPNKHFISGLHEHFKVTIQARVSALTLAKLALLLSPA